MDKKNLKAELPGLKHDIFGLILEGEMLKKYGSIEVGSMCAIWYQFTEQP